MLSRMRWFRRLTSSSKTGRRVLRPRRTVLRLDFEELEERCVPSTTYLVTSLADTNTSGTLRFAINQANLNNTGTAASPDLIQFATNGGTISVTGTALPALTDIAIIDGTTAPGYSGTPIIRLDGTLSGVGADGLTLSGGSSTIKGLAITNFSGNGIRLNTNGGNTIQSSYIGITTAGVAAANGASGIFVDAVPNNSIGGTGATAANVISGNSADGILIDGITAAGNQVVGNFLGTNASGTTAIGNAHNGIQLTNGTQQNTISGNVVSGNGANGVLITGGADFNTLSGNFIGTASGGAAALGNALDGVRIDGADHNLIGHSDPVTGITYYTADSVSIQPVSGWQGIRGSDTSGQYLITGTSNANGLLFNGTIAGVGTSYTVQFPGAFNTSVYGPDNLGQGKLRLVGNYKNPDYATAPSFRTALCSREQPPTSRTRANTAPSTIRVPSSTTSTARWAAWQSATTIAHPPTVWGTCPWVRATRSFMTCLPAHFLPTLSSLAP